MRPGIAAARCCRAVQAGLGQGRDAGSLTGEAKADLRRQALEWLKADLAGWDGRREAGRRTAALRSSRPDPLLAGVRSEEGLAKLPPAERRMEKPLGGSRPAADARRGIGGRAGRRAVNNERTNVRFGLTGLNLLSGFRW